MALRVKQSVTLSSPEMMGGQKLNASIQEIAAEHLALNIPLDNISLAKGLEIIIGFWDENASYEFPSAVLIDKKEDSRIVFISRPTVLSKKVNRAYTRLDLKSEGEILKEGEQERQKCLIMDFSAGGARITAQSFLVVQDLVKLDIKTMDKLFPDLSGRVLWKRDLRDQPGLSEYGLQFEQISQIRRNEINAYILKNKTPG